MYLTLFSSIISLLSLFRCTLASPSFDPSEYIGGHIATISQESVDIEKEFLMLFERISKDCNYIFDFVVKDAIKLQDSARSVEVIFQLNKLKFCMSNVPMIKHQRFSF